MRNIAIFDLDGTLANYVDNAPKRGSYYVPQYLEKAEVYEGVLSALKYKYYNWGIYIITGRRECLRKTTVDWLDKKRITDYHGLYLRPNYMHHERAIFWKLSVIADLLEYPVKDITLHIYDDKAKDLKILVEALKTALPEPDTVIKGFLCTKGKIEDI